MMGKAFSPAGLSGFFATHIVEGDLLHTGAIGGGFALSKGVYAEIEVFEEDKTLIETYVNGERFEATVAKRIVNRLLSFIPGTYHIIVKQRIEVPVGGGLGTSGASALAVGLALSKALKLRKTYLEIAREAHITDILEGKGLGTVSGLVVGGAVIVKKAGAPGFDEVDKLIIDPSLKLVIAYYAPIVKETILRNKRIEEIDKIGFKTLQKILEDPSIENFLKLCKDFAFSTGLVTRKVKQGLEKIEKIEGVVGASQAMIGDTLYAVVEEDRVEDVIEALASEAKVFSTDISWTPARILA